MASLTEHGRPNSCDYPTGSGEPRGNLQTPRSLESPYKNKGGTPGKGGPNKKHSTQERRSRKARKNQSGALQPSTQWVPRSVSQPPLARARAHPTRNLKRGAACHRRWLLLVAAMCCMYKAMTWRRWHPLLCPCTVVAPECRRTSVAGLFVAATQGPARINRLKWKKEGTLYPAPTTTPGARYGPPAANQDRSAMQATPHAPGPCR